MDMDELQEISEVLPDTVDALTDPFPEPEASEGSAADITVTPEQDAGSEQPDLEDSEDEENSNDLPGEETEGETDGETDEETGQEGAEEGETGGSAQIVYQIDPDAQYHAVIDNTPEESVPVTVLQEEPVPVTVLQEEPVPVVIAETLIEKDPGIMEKRLEDYTVTEGLLLLILIVLVLNLVFNYGRRLF